MDMSDMDENFFDTGDGNKTHFTLRIPARNKLMYEWLRKSYPGAPIPKEIQRAVVEKIEEINRKAPKPFEDVG